MKLSKQTLLLSLGIVIAAAFLGYRIADSRGWLKANAAEIGDESKTGQRKDKKQEKVQEALSSMNKKMGGKETAIVVEAEPVIGGQLIQRITAQGRVYGYQQLDVVNEVAARVVSVTVKDGQTVKQGDIIARLEEREYHLAVKEAETSLLSAQAEYLTYDQDESAIAEGSRTAKKKWDTLEAQFKKGKITKEAYRQQKYMLELDEIRSGTRRGDVIAAKTTEQSRIALQRAQINLEKCTVRAPFDGVVFDVAVAPGQVLNVGTKIARLVNLSDLVVKGKVLESEIGQVKEGRLAKVTFTAFPGMDAIDGRVEAISPYVNEEDKTIDTIIRFDNDKGRVKPGMFAEVVLDTAILEDRIMVPKSAILPRDNRIVIFKISDKNRAKWEYVETGAENEDFVEITKGNLEVGDMVLTNNHFTMGHDTLVKVAKKRR